MISPAITRALEAVRDGKVYVPDEPLIGFVEAERLGYLDVFYPGSGADDEQYVLTHKGREALGLPPVETFGGWLSRQLQGLRVRFGSARQG